MNFNDLLDEVKKLQHKELLLHLRISTCAGITPEGTHPYKLGNLLKLEGRTRKPVICMNGIIQGQQLHYKQGNQLNDTASYILDHKEAFKVINEDILDIIEDSTSCRWAAATPAGIILSKGFIYDEGLYYSNLNHKDNWYKYYLDEWNGYTINQNNPQHIEDYLPDELIDKLPDELSWDVQDYIYLCCANNKYSCTNCNSCLYKVDTKKEVQNFINNNKHNLKYEDY